MEQQQQKQQHNESHMFKDTAVASYLKSTNEWDKRSCKRQQQQQKQQQRPYKWQVIWKLGKWPNYLPKRVKKIRTEQQ